MEGVLPELHMRLKPKITVIEYLAKKATEHPEFTWSAVGSGPLFDWVCPTSSIDPRELADRGSNDLKIRVSRHLVEVPHCYDY
jgi:hypothetical protein